MTLVYEFTPWPKIGRLNQKCIITEKLDGTNAAIRFTPVGQMLVQSRNRFITPDSDNYGFARWCTVNQQELIKLGEGIHFGEWWGNGIQTGYGLKEKRFSTFSTWRPVDTLPSCVSQVPVLYEGDFSKDAVDFCMESLRANGSVAAPGFMQPEGVIIMMVASKERFKVTFRDSAGKWAGKENS